ncbi:ABC transporter permease [Gottfriedia acidiceleris]|uniref:ABC transporter permease n=1 Tax=Gottfriedia acidiceleris TaxID=371036 RepID=UPI002F25F2FC
MKKLINIELKKFSLKKHIFHVLIANVCLLMLILMTTYVNNSSEVIPGMPQIATITVLDTFIKAVFLVWQSILIANLIVEEFRSKTILILFTYPIDRKKLILSKLLLIFMITLLSIIGSQILLNLVLFGLDTILPFINYSISLMDIGLMFITTITSIMLGMLTLYIGMLNKSTVATVASSLVIVSLAVSSGGDKGGLITMIPVSITLGVIGVALAYMSIKKMLSADSVI